MQTAIDEIRIGRPVVVLDDADRENEGDLIFAAELATPELLAFVIRHTSGFVCVARPSEECSRLRLEAMPVASRDRFSTAYRITVDLIGTGTGISAAARAGTIAAFASPAHGLRDFIRPGHVVPLQARDGGVLRRTGHTEAAVDLARLAGLRPVAGLCEIVTTRNPATMACGEELFEFAAEHGLVAVTVSELAAYRLQTEPLVERGAEIALPTRHGPFRGIGYRDTTTADEHIALLAAATDLDRDILVYVHHECLVGDVFGGLGCACSSRLDTVLADFGRSGRGVVVYLRSDRPRRCHDIEAPASSSAASETPAYIAAALLEDLGVRRADLLHAEHAHPAQVAALHARGITAADLRPPLWNSLTIA